MKIVMRNTDTVTGLFFFCLSLVLLWQTRQFATSMETVRAIGPAGFPERYRWNHVCPQPIALCSGHAETRSFPLGGWGIFAERWPVHRNYPLYGEFHFFTGIPRGCPLDVLLSRRDAVYHRRPFIQAHVSRCLPRFGDDVWYLCVLPQYCFSQGGDRGLKEPFPG